MVLGVGSFAHSTIHLLKENGARVIGYLSRDYGHFGAQSETTTYFHKEHPSPIPLLRKHKVDLVLPMSIDWAEKPWAEELINSGIPIFCPSAEALKLEKERDFAREL